MLHQWGRTPHGRYHPTARPLRETRPGGRAMQSRTKVSASWSRRPEPNSLYCGARSRVMARHVPEPRREPRGGPTNPPGRPLRSPTPPRSAARRRSDSWRACTSPVPCARRSPRHRPVGCRRPRRVGPCFWDEEAAAGCWGNNTTGNGAVAENRNAANDPMLGRGSETPAGQRPGKSDPLRGE
jgi:hypothetical protein